MTPEQLAKTGTESGHQRAVFCWCNLNRQEWPLLQLLFHIPNGGSRGDTAKSRAIAGGAMKAEGVKAGVADLFLPVARGGFYGFWLEMKKPGKIKDVSKAQREFGEAMTQQGYLWAVVDNWESAVDYLKKYLAM